MSKKVNSLLCVVLKGGALRVRANKDSRVSRRNAVYVNELPGKGKSMGNKDVE